jgi:hypothetical protein
MFGMGLFSGSGIQNDLAVTINGIPRPVAPITITATFEAEYAGSELACAVGDGVTFTGQSDCLIWKGASSQDYAGSVTLTDPVPGTNLNLLVTLTNAAGDGPITPTISLALAPNTSVPTNVPEPDSLGLLVAGLLGLGLATRHRRA